MVKSIQLAKHVFGALCVIAVAVIMSIPLKGCDAARRATQPPQRYLPSQQFDKQGPCMNGVCPRIHEHKTLPPC